MTFFNYPAVDPNNRSASQYAQPGLNHTPEYMASGLPYVSTSQLDTTVSTIELPYVSNQINFHASGGTLRFGFTENGVNGSNYFLVHSNDGNYTFDLRCKTIYVRADSGTVTMSFCAGLTQIDRDRLPVLTGSLADPITGKFAYNTGSVAYEIGYDGLG